MVYFVYNSADIVKNTEMHGEQHGEFHWSVNVCGFWSDSAVTQHL